MKCISCDEEARAICKFCGRAVCKMHIAERRYVSGFTSFGKLFALTDNGISIDDAVWCQKCNPVPRRTS
jgi:hypothetical protein